MTFPTLRKFRFAVAALPALWLAGCPGTPILTVTPGAISFEGSGQPQQVFISNTGDGTLRWSVEEVVRANEEADWTPGEVPWLTATPESGDTRNETDNIELAVNLEGIPAGLVNNTGIRITSNGGDRVVPVSLAIEPTVVAQPERINVNPEETEAAFSVVNTGPATATWEIAFLPDPENPANVTAIPSDILVQPTSGSTAPDSETPVTVTFPAGRDSFTLVVQSPGGTSTVEFVFGEPLEGLTVSPAEISLFVNSLEETGEQAQSTVRVTNSATEAQTWTISFENTADPDSPPAIAATPDTSTTAPGQTTEVQVRVTNPTEIELGAGNYNMILTSGEGFLSIPIVVELMSLPVIAISEPPDEEVGRPEIIPVDVLDFGRESVTGEVYIANTGPRNSRLNFVITYEGQGTDDTLIASVEPLQGDTNGPERIFFFPTDTNERIDAQQIRIVVDRSQLEQDVEFRTVTVTAYNADFTAPLDAVEPAEFRVRVERQPLKIEGAINRSRPPFLMRFVFLLRDSLSRVIPTVSASDLAKLDFGISENGIPLDLNETNLFLEGPENLRVNLVLLLDYTGSMLSAGTNANPPLLPGQAIEQVKQAAKEFIDDLPPSYRIALMYHRDRQQSERVIHPFSTDKESLKDSLDEFTLPVELHRVTAVNDALIDAMSRIAAEDPSETLPFDDADVRSIVYITDGRDNASLNDFSQVANLAEETRTRLYPMIYAAGGQTNLADHVELAEASGGHLYNAGAVQNLVRLLANEAGLALDDVDQQLPNQVSFAVRNAGGADLTWSASAGENAPWITNLAPAGGTIPVGGSTNVTVTVNPSIIGANTDDEGDVFITSNNGNGTAHVRVQVGANAATAESITASLTDVPGTVWSELQNQLVLTYVTPSQTGGDYEIAVQYQETPSRVIAGSFQENGVFLGGDVDAGQISLTTSGIFSLPGETNPDLATRAEVFVRTDYVPPNVNRFRMRFFLLPADDVSAEAAAALRQADLSFELAAGGLLVGDDAFTPDWRLIDQGDGSVLLLTNESNPLAYGAFGTLLKITVTNIDEYVALLGAAQRAPEFQMAMRVDNTLYANPEVPGADPIYFLYPTGLTNPEGLLTIGDASDLAAPARTIIDLAVPNVDPRDPDAWDRDEDGIFDFNDPQPDDEDLPGTLTVPNPLDIDSGVAVASFTIRNNRLDTFTWSIDTPLPGFISRVSFGTPAPGPGDPGPAPRATLAPGESERINLHLDRSGLAPGSVTRANLTVEIDVFPDEVLPITIVN